MRAEFAGNHGELYLTDRDEDKYCLCAVKSSHLKPLCCEMLVLHCLLDISLGIAVEIYGIQQSCETFSGPNMSYSATRKSN